MQRIWIRDKCTVQEEEIINRVLQYADRFRYMIAYYTDCFMVEYATAESIASLITDSLLELRVFDGNIEVLARRGAIGSDFHWRVADDTYMSSRYAELRSSSDSGLPDALEMIYIDGRQKIDCNPEKTIVKGEKSIVMSTVGGRYELPCDIPIGYITTRTYYSYDTDGMASAVDYRLSGFVDEGGKQL